MTAECCQAFIGACALGRWQRSVTIMAWTDAHSRRRARAMLPGLAGRSPSRWNSIRSHLFNGCPTGVGIWQVYAYFRDGPRLRLTAGGNREIGGGGYVDPNTYFVVNVVNVGNRATTIQAVGMCVFDNWLGSWPRQAPLFAATAASALCTDGGPVARYC